jgi:integrase
LRDLKAWFRLPKPEGRGLKSDQEARLAFAALRAVVTWYRVDHPRFLAPDWPSMPTALTAKHENEAERNTNRLTLPEVVRGIDCIPPEHQPLFWILFYTGCRTSEARGVLGRDWVRSRLTICRSAATKHAGSEIRNTTKTGETGTWDLPADVCDLIDRHCTGGRFSGDAPLFVDPHGLVRSYDWVRDEWARATKKAGIPSVPPYRAFKHTQVAALIDSGLPIEDLINQYRWTSDQMVDHYDERKDERRSGVVAKLKPMVEKARTNNDLSG